MLKRMVLSIVALSFLLACYMVYVRVFGHLSGMDEIDPKFLQGGMAKDPRVMAPDPNRQNYARTVAERVFGKDSWQAQEDVIALYWLHSGIIIFISDYEKLSPQALRLTPFSLVHTEAAKKTGAMSQIVTLEGNEAVLEFDKPIDIYQAAGAKPTGGKISGNVQIQADRGTPDPSDDIITYTDYLEFLESENRIWTESAVRIVSADTVMTGTGGELNLKHDETQKKTRDMPMFRGVHDVVLFKDVQINMLAGAGGGVMPGAAKASKETAKEERKTPLTITSQGRFSYNLEEGTALFKENVMMIRQTNESQFDRLFCDELHITFDKAKSTEPDETMERDPNAMKLQFRVAHATGRAVRVLSDSQSTEAIGTEMHHDASTGQTVLRGEPEVVATQGSNVLHGRQLTFSTTGQNQRTAEASGPGSLESRDGETGEVKLLAHWTEWARIDPPTEQREQHLLTFQGAVELNQPGRGLLNGDRMKVWLTHGDAAPGTAEKKTGSDSSAWVPTRIEAVGNVTANSEQFDLEAISRLEVAFEEGAIRAAPSAKSGASTSAAQAATNRQSNPVAKSVPDGSAADSITGPDLSGKSRPDAATPTREPAHLRADTIRIKAIHSENRTELAELWTEGSVDLIQPPDETGNDGVVVQGDTLYLKRIELKNHMEVTGKPAHVEMHGMKVDGAHVGVDQPTGVAWAEGKGTMTVLSDTSFEGAKLDAPSELTVAWGTNMFFNGKVAEFGGGVRAQQEANTMQCGRLEVFLAERIDISAPKQQGHNNAKISGLICTQAVQVDNSVRDNGQLEKYEHLEAEWVEFTNSDGRTKAKGPGVVRSYTHGQDGMLPVQANQPAAKPAANAPATADSNQLYLTEVHFTDRMDANRTQQIANFFGHVEVFHCPANNENTLVDPDNLPEGSMRLACEELEMATKTGPNKQAYHELVGTGNIDVEANTFSGRGDRISYNQLHDRLIFQSRPGSFATLYRQLRPGEPWDMTRAFKIFFYRRTGQVRVEGGIMIDLQEREADRKGNQKTPPKKF